MKGKEPSVMSINTFQTIEAIKHHLDVIASKEPEVIEVIYEVIEHVANTYSDKYQSEAAEVVDTKALLLSKSGKVANLHSAMKYLQRYLSEGFEKSNIRLDVKKAIHYLIFELQRRERHD